MNDREHEAKVREAAARTTEQTQKASKFVKAFIQISPSKEGRCCREAERLQTFLFAPEKAPLLPLPECDRGRCQCVLIPATEDVAKSLIASGTAHWAE